MKQCNLCKETKSLDDFHRQQHGKYGRAGRCKLCKKIWVAQNRCKVNQSNYAWRSRNSDRVRASQQKYDAQRAFEQHKYYLEHRDEMLEYSRQWYQRNRERVREHRRPLDREWHRQHPESGVNAIAKRRKLIGDQAITKQDWLDLMNSASWRCAYCGIELTRLNRTLDHVVPLNRGGAHTVENLIPACKACNFSKRDKLLSEWQPSDHPPLG